MTLDSFNLANQFDERVIRPSAMTGIDAALFRAGLCSCPQCLANELKRLGYYEESQWLYDRSMTSLHNRSTLSDFENQEFSIERKIELLQLRASHAISDVNPAITRAMRNAGVVSDGSLSPRIAVRYRAGYRQDRHSRDTRAGYNHLSGHGSACTAQSEHNQIAYLIGERLIKMIESQYSASVTDILHDKALTGASGRRPDVQFVVHAPNREPLKVALEVQRSPLDINVFRARHHALLDNADQVIWIFRKRGLPDNLRTKSSRLRDCMQYANTQSGKVWVYCLNTDNESVVVNPAKLELIPGHRLIFNVSEFENPQHNDTRRCNRLEEPVTDQVKPLTKEAVIEFSLNLFGELQPQSIADVKKQNKLKATIEPDSSPCYLPKDRAERIAIFEAKRVISEIFSDATKLKHFQVDACVQELILLTDASLLADVFRIRCNYAWQFDDAMQVLARVDVERCQRVNKLLEQFYAGLVHEEELWQLVYTHNDYSCVASGKDFWALIDEWWDTSKLSAEDKQLTEYTAQKEGQFEFGDDNFGVSVQKIDLKHK